jgi:hypothetical protein
VARRSWSVAGACLVCAWMLPRYDQGAVGARSAVANVRLAVAKVRPGCG